MLWTMEVTSEGSQDDLRYIFPYMMAAASGYVGQNSGVKRTETIGNHDPRLLALKYPDRLVTVIINEATKGKSIKKINMTVYQDVYRGGNLFIKAGTRCSSDLMFRSDYTLFMPDLSTTSVNGKEVHLGSVYFSGLSLGTQAEAREGTLLYLLMN
jgi:hypothetical protein